MDFLEARKRIMKELRNYVSQGEEVGEVPELEIYKRYVTRRMRTHF